MGMSSSPTAGSVGFTNSWTVTPMISGPYGTINVNMGDGTTYHTLSGTHDYETPGTYMQSYEVYNLEDPPQSDMSGGDTITVWTPFTGSLTINPWIALVPEDSAITVPMHWSVTASDSIMSGNIVFGDSGSESVSSMGQDGTHHYPASYPATYLVELSITDIHGQNFYLSQNFYVNNIGDYNDEIIGDPPPPPPPIYITVEGGSKKNIMSGKRV